MENRTTRNTRYMVELALMSAIIVLMAMTPLGYVRTPALSITLLTIPVAVGSIILGPKGGAILGAVFGATSFAQAVSGGGGMTAILFQSNPLGTTFLCFVPDKSARGNIPVFRTTNLRGLLVRSDFSAFQKNKSKKSRLLYRRDFLSDF